MEYLADRDVWKLKSKVKPFRKTAYFIILHHKVSVLRRPRDTSEPVLQLEDTSTNGTGLAHSTEWLPVRKGEVRELPRSTQLLFPLSGRPGEPPVSEQEIARNMPSWYSRGMTFRDIRDYILEHIRETYIDVYSLRGPLASLNGISVNLAELFLKLPGLFLNVFRTIPKICIYIYISTLIWLI